MYISYESRTDCSYHSVDVAETSRNREVRGDRAQGSVDVPDILWLGVEAVVVDIFVVDAILLSASNANFHLKPLLHGCCALEILLGRSDVVFLVFFGQVDLALVKIDLE